MQAFERVVAVQPVARRSSAAQTVATAVAAFALVAVATHMGFSSGDSLLQTAYQAPGSAQMSMAQMNMARAIPQMPVQYAQAIPVNGVSPQLAVMAKPMQVQGQILQDEAPPAEAPPAEAPPAEAAPAEGAAPAAGGEGTFGSAEAAMGAAEGAAAGTGPGAALGTPQTQACTSPCPNPVCTDTAGMGCYEAQGVPPMVTWECKCPPPPPPPVVGSPEWLNSDDQKIEDPGMVNAGAGANLAMYQSGKIAVNLNKYLAASAERIKTQADIENLIYKDLAAVSKANRGAAGEGDVEGEAGEAGEDSAEEGFPHEIFGFHTGI